MGNMWHVKNWFRVGHNISWRLNFHTLLGFLYLSHPRDCFYQQAQKKHEFVLSYLKKEMEPVIEKYRAVPEIPTEKTEPSNRIIWTLWWQGEENAPPLVRACIDTMKKNSNGARLIVITRDNIADYIVLPNYILEKNAKGYICNAALSDIIRYALLEKHGGLWLDSTIFVSKPIPPEYFTYSFFSQHTQPVEKTAWVQNNAYHGFVVGGKPGAKMVSFAKEMFFEYWKTHDTAVDYLMVDYILYLAMREYPEIRQEINSLPWSSERLYELVSLLDSPFDKAHFDQLCDACIFSKLDWHRKYRDTVRGRPTYYHHLLNCGKTNPSEGC